MAESIFLSSPDVGPDEREALLGAFDSGWIAPVGPALARFEEELVEYTGAEAAVALSSGTAALHLGLLGVGVRPGDRVVVQTATFAATAFAVMHTGAVPLFCGPFLRRMILYVLPRLVDLLKSEKSTNQDDLMVLRKTAGVGDLLPGVTGPIQHQGGETGFFAETSWGPIRTLAAESPSWSAVPKKTLTLSAQLHPQKQAG